MKASDLSRLVTAKTERRPIALVTDLGSNQQALFEPGNEAPALSLSPAARAAVAEALAANKSGEIEVEGRRLFVQARVPSPRLVIVGAVHITQALAPMAALAGYEVIVVDPRRAFATAERFPGLTLRHDWPDEALDAIRLDESSAVVTLTHDPKLDDPGARPRLALAGVLYRLARQQEDPRRAPAALVRSGLRQRGAGAHPWAGRPCHRRQVAGGDRGLGPRAIDRRAPRPAHAMIFAELPVEDCVGAVLAHALRNGEVAFKKGRILSAADIEAIKKSRPPHHHRRAPRGGRCRRGRRRRRARRAARAPRDCASRRRSPAASTSMPARAASCASTPRKSTPSTRWTRRSRSRPSRTMPRWSRTRWRRPSRSSRSP